MKIVCDQCDKHLGDVQATARLILTVHCGFCGKDFGVAVDGPVQVELKPGTPAGDAPAA